MPSKLFLKYEFIAAMNKSLTKEIGELKWEIVRLFRNLW